MNNIQDKRDLKISYNKSGAGNVSARVILPITWVREMGLSQEFPAVIASFDGEYLMLRGGVIKLRDEELKDYQDFLKSDDYLGWQYEESDD